MKQRYWSCFKCGRVERRFKGEESKTCSCDYEMFATRTTKKANKVCSRINRRDWKISNKINRFNDRQYSKLRNQSGEILKFSKQTKQIWKRIKKAKTLLTLHRQGQLFINSLTEDVCIIKEDKYIKKIEPNGKISEHRGGLSSSPNLILVSKTTYKAIDDNGNSDGKLYGRFGTYRRAILQGLYQIELSRDIKDLNEIKHTFLHELVHWIEDMTDGGDREYGHHDRYFWMRLKLLEKTFKV